MLSSIHPLGERSRHNRWGLTVLGHVVGSGAGGVTAFTLAAAVGIALPDIAALAVVVAVAAAALEVASLRGRRIPGPRRQVNEDWLQLYRGWVYGIGFGFQLGAGLLTIVTTAATYLALALTALAGDLRAGVVVGSVFGLTRALPLLMAGRVDRPDRLRVLHARIGALAEPVRVVTTTALVSLALGFVVAGVS